MKTKVIVAGNIEQARLYCEQNAINLKEAVYPKGIFDIAGLSNCDVIYTGAYWENPIYGNPSLESLSINA